MATSQTAAPAPTVAAPVIPAGGYVNMPLEAVRVTQDGRSITLVSAKPELRDVTFSLNMNSAVAEAIMEQSDMSGHLFGNFEVSAINPLNLNPIGIDGTAYGINVLGFQALTAEAYKQACGLHAVDLTDVVASLKPNRRAFVPQRREAAQVVQTPLARIEAAVARKRALNA